MSRSKVLNKVIFALSVVSLVTAVMPIKSASADSSGYYKVTKKYVSDEDKFIGLLSEDGTELLINVSDYDYKELDTEDEISQSDFNDLKSNLVEDRKKEDIFAWSCVGVFAIVAFFTCIVLFK